MSFHCISRPRTNSYPDAIPNSNGRPNADAWAHYRGN